jgi:hypothetical protein
MENPIQSKMIGEVDKDEYFYKNGFLGYRKLNFQNYNEKCLRLLFISYI